MRWIFLLAMAAHVFLGCEDDSETSTSQIVLIEAPNRLSYVVATWDPQPFETTAVRFSLKLSPQVQGLDTVVCNIYDATDGKVDSFLLIDDGNQVEHWDHSPCETVLTGDSVAGDGQYSRLIHAFEFTANYSGAEYTFRFSAKHANRTIRDAEHFAETWAPWFTLDSVRFEPEQVPPCEDSTIVTMKLLRDSTDFIESVVLGFMGGNGNVYGNLASFTALSGDSLWRAAVWHNSTDWDDMDASGLVVGVNGLIGGTHIYSLTPYYTVPFPELSADLTADTLRIREFGVAETLWVHVLASLCPNRTPDRLTLDLYAVAVPANWTFENESELNDCGTDWDSVANDHVFSTIVLFRADSAAQENGAIVQMLGGVSSHPNPCEWRGQVRPISLHKRVILVPPQ